MAGKRYIAKQTFGINVDGEQITVAQGEVLNTANKVGSQIIKQLGKNSEHLSDFESYGRFDEENVKEPKVEQATASPGEKRATSTSTRTNTTKGSKS